MKAQNKVIGVGSPIVDRIVRVEEDFLFRIDGEKGGMELVDSQGMSQLLKSTPGKAASAPGGSAANTIFALSRLNMPCVFLGKLGNDEHGRYYMDVFESIGGDCSRFKICDREETASCLSLVTPDSERTMRTNLGAAAGLSPAEISPKDFEHCRHAHIEGYLLFNQDLAGQALDSAKTAGCTVSLDLGSFEVVNQSSAVLKELLEKYVDVVMANQDEAAAFCGDDDPWSGLKALSELCPVAAVKLGDQGVIIKGNGVACQVAAPKVKGVLDATGAGDFWAAGFLYGNLNGRSLADSGHLGNILGAEAVQCLGADLPRQTWSSTIDYFENYMQERSRD